MLPGRALLGNEITILALFALSLDLLLGYAGIVSLGHAAFFGTGAYIAALVAKHVMPDPLAGLTVAVYTLSAALAGATGALLAQTAGFAWLDVLDFHRSADVVLVAVIGGTGWLWGDLLGAIVFKLLHDAISALTPQYWTFWLGLFLVVLMLVGRERLLQPWARWTRARDDKGASR